MHIPTKFVLFCLLSLPIYSCQSVSDQINKSFDKVNKSLERSNKVLLASDSLAYYHLSIDARSASDTAHKADSLYAATLHALKLIDLAKDLLHAADSSGNSTRTAAALLIHTSIGDSLRNAVREVSRLCLENLANAGQHLSPDKLFNDSAKIANQRWVDELTGQPTIQALTLLSSLEGDCIQATIRTLYDVDAQLKQP